MEPLLRTQRLHPRASLSAPGLDAENLQALRSRNSYYHFDRSHLDHGLLAYERTPDNNAEPAVMVLLNFGDYEGELSVPFPRSGQWIEQLNHGDVQAAQTLDLPHGQTEATVRVPSNYGKVFVSV